MAQTQSWHVTTTCDSLTGRLDNRGECELNFLLDPVWRVAVFGVTLFTPSRISISPYGACQPVPGAKDPKMTYLIRPVSPHLQAEIELVVRAGMVGDSQSIQLAMF